MEPNTSLERIRISSKTDVLSKGNAKLVRQGIASLVASEGINLDEVRTTKGGTDHFATVKVNILCEVCGIKLIDKVRAFFESRYHRRLCMGCQKWPFAGA